MRSLSGNKKALREYEAKADHRRTQRETRRRAIENIYEQADAGSKPRRQLESPAQYKGNR